MVVLESPPSRPWVYRMPSESAVSEMVRAFRISDVAARILVGRGFFSPGRDAAGESAGRCPIRAFLEPSLRDLHDPLLLDGMEGAAERILRARRDSEQVLVHGDYDVDGLSSAALLVRLFRLIGVRTTVHIPDRVVDGYGVRAARIEAAAREGIRLIVTVDSGIRSVDEVECARRLGTDCIVTDHHEPGPELPQAVAVVNPKLGQRYPFRDLAGVGVAFKLAWAVSQRLAGSTRLSEPFRRFLLDAMAYVALGTVADVVPLLGENRILVHHGLRALEGSCFSGLRALCRAAGGKVDAEAVAFRLAPRLNAAGRLGMADRALALLLCDDDTRARALANDLEALNRERRRFEEEILRDVKPLVAGATGPAVVISGVGWHPGVLGIVASRIVDWTGRPAVVITTHGTDGRGSVRGSKGVPVHKVLESCGHHLRRFGGHAGAGGLEIDAGRIGAFRDSFLEAVSRHGLSEPEPVVVDLELPLALMDGPLLREMQRLAPFGEGNPRPVVACGPCTLGDSPRAVGAEGTHLAFTVRQGSVTRRAIAFGMAHRLPELLAARDRLRLAFHVIPDTWKGGPPELDIVDFGTGRREEATESAEHAEERRQGLSLPTLAPSP